MGTRSGARFRERQFRFSPLNPSLRHGSKRSDEVNQRRQTLKHC